MSPSPAWAPPDLPEDAVEQGPVGLLSSIVLGAGAMPMGLATRGWPGGCRRWLLPFFCPRGVLAAPGGLGALDGGLRPRAASALLGPSEPRLSLAPPPGQGLSLSTTLGSHNPHLWLLGTRGWVWAMLPLSLLCGHEERGDRAQRCSTREHPWLSKPVKRLMHPESRWPGIGP